MRSAGSVSPEAGWVLLPHSHSDSSCHEGGGAEIKGQAGRVVVMEIEEQNYEFMEVQEQAEEDMEVECSAWLKQLWNSPHP